MQPESVLQEGTTPHPLRAEDQYFRQGLFRESLFVWRQFFYAYLKKQYQLCIYFPGYLYAFPLG